MSNTVERILQRPDAVQVAEQLKAALAAEAERRTAFRQWVDDSVKAEFINGETIYHSPAKKKHLEVSRLLGGLLNYYTLSKKLGTVWIEKAMISLTRNDYEPDIVFFTKSKADAFKKDQLLFPAPDFVVEILSKRTASKDRGIKKQDYAAHGIREYWIVDPDRERVEQYLIVGDSTTYFEPYLFTIDEEVESQVVTGFRIPVRALFDTEANVQALNTLMNI